MERSVHPGRGVFGTAHSRRMGVISSALPGLSGEGGSTDGEEEGKKRREQWPGERQKENKRTHLGGMQREDEKKEGEIGKGEW